MAATLLSTAFREQMKKTKDISQKTEMSYSVSYPTGFLNLDFANGYIQEIDGNRRFELGISDGSINMFISDSGLGKTTITTQIGCNIIKQFPGSVCFYEQAEVGTNIQRIKNLSGFRTNEEFTNRFVIRDSGITIQSLFARVKQIYNIKISNEAAYTYDTGLSDMRGNPIKKYVPTIIIVDSVKMVMSDVNLEREDASNMDGATNAKANSDYYTRMVPMCRQANIIMLLINHISTYIHTGYGHRKPELPYLKELEHISGGKDLTYIQNNIFRLDQREKLSPDKSFGITGSLVDLDIVKSRTNKTSKARCTLVFDQEIGYDPDLSLFMLLKDNNLLGGSGAYLTIPGCETKFSQRQFKTVLYQDKEFYNKFVSLCYEFLTTTLINEFERQKEEERMRFETVTPYQAILNKLNEEHRIAS